MSVGRTLRISVALTEVVTALEGHDADRHADRHVLPEGALSAGALWRTTEPSAVGLAVPVRLDGVPARLS